MQRNCIAKLITTSVKEIFLVVQKVLF